MNETSVKILILGRQLCERRCNKLTYMTYLLVFFRIFASSGVKVSRYDRLTENLFFEFEKT